jgi:hypothetical protein
MSKTPLIGRRREEVPCTVEINNTFEELGAHLRFDNGVVVHPGDEVMVHGAPVEVPYGHCLLNPRFYTTDFDEMDKTRRDAGARGMGRADRRDARGPQQGHFKKTEDWDDVDFEDLRARAEEGAGRLPGLLR